MSFASSTRLGWWPVLGSICLLGFVISGLDRTTLAQSRQPMDEDFAKRIREWTTAPEFLSPLVDHLPKVDGVPSPFDVLGRHAGAPRELTYYAELLEYYRALAAASPRVATMSIGRTDEDREMIVVAIASDATIRDLEQYRADLAQLAYRLAGWTAISAGASRGPAASVHLASPRGRGSTPSRPPPV